VSVICASGKKICGLKRHSGHVSLAKPVKRGPGSGKIGGKGGYAKYIGIENVRIRIALALETSRLRSRGGRFPALLLLALLERITVCKTLDYY
jgi:hypothetical protein